MWAVAVEKCRCWLVLVPTDVEGSRYASITLCIRRNCWLRKRFRFQSILKQTHIDRRKQAANVVTSDSLEY